ncbi:MAG: recombination protein NinG [Gloeomargaritales cyanobacterium]
MAKPKSCKNCKEKFTPEYNPLQFLCSPRCAIEYNKKAVERKEKDEWKVKKKEMVEKLKTLSDYKAGLEKEINAIVRLIDKGHECISGGFDNYVVHAGHLYSVGAFPSIRFNLLNIYAQSEHDNYHLHGNCAIYKERIVEIFGKAASDEIENLKVKYPKLQASVPQIKEATEIARRIKESLIKMDTYYEIEERISLRIIYNKMIGLYK